LFDRDALSTYVDAVKIMSGKQSKNLASVYFFYLGFFLFLSSHAFAQQKTGSEGHGEEASAAQAQATMASLFGRGARMTAIPRINGTIALPVFDSSRMTIDDRGLRAAEQQETKPEDRRQLP